MDFNNYKPASYGTPVFDRYLYDTRYKAELPKPSQTKDKGFSLEEILGMDESRLLDKVVNTACSITYRLRLYEESKKIFTDKFNELSLAIGSLSHLRVEYSPNAARRLSMLIKERNMIELKALESKIQTWEQLQEPLSTFVTYFHKRLEGTQDRKILGERK